MFKLLPLIFWFHLIFFLFLLFYFPSKLFKTMFSFFPFALQSRLQLMKACATSDKKKAMADPYPEVRTVSAEFICLLNKCFVFQLGTKSESEYLSK